MNDVIPSRATLEQEQVDGLPGVVAKVRWFEGVAVGGFFSGMLMALPAVLLTSGPWMMGLALVPVLVILYWTLTGIINRTTIVYGKRLTVRHGPLPLMGTLDVPSDHVTAFELREWRARHSRGGSSHWEALAIVDGTPHLLLPGVQAHAENKWLVDVCQRALAARKP